MHAFSEFIPHLLALRVNSNNNNDQETKSKSSVEETATGLYSPLDFIQPEVKQTELDNAFTERNCVINCAADYVYKIIIVGDRCVIPSLFSFSLIVELESPV